MRAREPLHELAVADSAHFVERVGQAPRAARRAGFGVRAAAAMLLLVLGDIEQMREEAERPHHVHRLPEIELVQQPLELALAGVLAAERDRGLPDALDAAEGLLSRLVAGHLPQQPPQEPTVLAQQV